MTAEGASIGVRTLIVVLSAFPLFMFAIYIANECRRRWLRLSKSLQGQRVRLIFTLGPLAFPRLSFCIPRRIYAWLGGPLLVRLPLARIMSWSEQDLVLLLRNRDGRYAYLCSNKDATTRRFEVGIRHLIDSATQGEFARLWPPASLVQSKLGLDGVTEEHLAFLGYLTPFHGSRRVQWVWRFDLRDEAECDLLQSQLGIGVVRWLQADELPSKYRGDSPTDSVSCSTLLAVTPPASHMVPLEIGVGSGSEQLCVSTETLLLLPLL